MIAPALERYAVEIGRLRLDPGNVRRHPARNLAAIRRSLERFGQQSPVVCRRDGTVIAGNGTLAAAIELGWNRLAAVTFAADGDEDVAAKAYAIADNRSGELAEWDTEALGLTMSMLGGRVSWSELGFSEAEVRRIAPTPPENFAPIDEGEGFEHECPRCSYGWNGEPRP